MSRPEDIFKPIGNVTTGEMPPELVYGLLHPTGDTLIYAYGGSGKGVIAAWCAAQDLKAGLVPGILDYESNPDEWYRRVQGFLGAHTGLLDNLRIVLPSYESGGFLEGPVWAQAEEIAGAIADLAIQRVYVDSIVPATEVGDSQLGSPEVPINYGRAMRTLQVPTVSIGHASGAMKKENLAKPWGSHYWRNVPRLTWALWLDEDRQRVEVTVTKRNAYRKRRLAVDWAWADELGDGETPSELVWSGLTFGITDRIIEILKGGALSFADLQEQITSAAKVTEEKPPTKQAISNALTRGKAFQKTDDGSWSLVPEPAISARKRVQKASGDGPR